MSRQSACAAGRRLAAVLLVLVALPSRADPGGILYEIRGGVLDHATRLTTSGRESGTDFNLELVFDHVPLPGRPLPYVGVSANTTEDTDQLYTGLGWRLAPSDRWFVGFGGGLAVHNGEVLSSAADKRSLGREYLFHAALELALRVSEHFDLSLYYQHISNGPLHGKEGVNDGLDNAGARVGYRF